ncbi:MAG: IS66 family insertion sequence element accessory protein TnpB, partial [Proteobacteria bacterium]|nr:IS66 family insertion sequence element accessory protein TnpB [Pseudomonadota bacterium]
MIRPSDDSVIYLYRHAVDMRKSINGLVAIVEGEMEMDPFSSALFVFCNTNRTIIKL